MTRAETREYTAGLVEAFLKNGGKIQKVPMVKRGRRGKSDEQKIAELEAELERLQNVA